MSEQNFNSQWEQPSPGQNPPWQARRRSPWALPLLATLSAVVLGVLTGWSIAVANYGDGATLTQECIDQEISLQHAFQPYVELLNGQTSRQTFHFAEVARNLEEVSAVSNRLYDLGICA